MLFFSKKYKLTDTGILNGATDWHSHILPGVDDGIGKMKDSLATLSYYENIGVKEVWLTPHIMEDIPNSIEELQAVYAELQEAYKGSIRLYLAAENMLDNLFDERFETGQLLPIGPEKDHLLVETSYFQPPMDLYGTLKRIQEAGYHPILAHPERYGYMTELDYNRLAQMKVKLQLNLMTLAGGYGKTAQDKANMLLSRGQYSFFGSDLHRLKHFQDGANHKVLKKETAKQLQGIINHI